MGPVVSAVQQRAVMDGRARLMRDTTVLHGGDGLQLVDADAAVGAFVPPTLLGCENPFAAESVHAIEVFGPVATLMPYGGVEEAVQIAERGGGSLVASIYSADAATAQSLAEALAPTHGRVNVVNGAVAKSATGHGNVMPQSLHGGPGRAGNGQELGGLRALRLYHQLTALQGPKDVLMALQGLASW